MTNVSSTESDEMVGEMLRTAVGLRVDGVLRGKLPSRRPAVVRTNLRRRRLAIPVLVVLSAVGLTGGVAHRLAQRPTPSPVDVVVRADASADEPRLVLRAAGLAPVQHVSAEMMSLSANAPKSIHLRDGTTSFDFSIEAPGSRFLFPEGATTRSVTIGSGTGTLAQSDRGWALDWEIGDMALRSSGRSVCNQATFDVLAAVRATSSKSLSTVGPFPHGFTATLVGPEVGGHQIGYRESPSDRVSYHYLSVQPNLRFAEDYLGGQPTVQRGGRTYAIDSFNVIGQDLGATVSFDSGAYNVRLSGPGKREAVLALAEQVVVATLMSGRGSSVWRRSAWFALCCTNCSWKQTRHSRRWESSDGATSSRSNNGLYWSHSPPPGRCPTTCCASTKKCRWHSCAGPGGSRRLPASRGPTDCTSGSPPFFKPEASCTSTTSGRTGRRCPHFCPNPKRFCATVPDRCCSHFRPNPKRFCATLRI